MPPRVADGAELVPGKPLSRVPVDKDGYRPVLVPVGVRCWLMGLWPEVKLGAELGGESAGVLP